MSKWEHSSRGPVSTLPGHITRLPEGVVLCDTHATRSAIVRVQGETDSFGCEYLYLCRECYDMHKQEVLEELEQEQMCDICSQVSVDCRPSRDPAEGIAGRVYNACTTCRNNLQESFLGEDGY